MYLGITETVEKIGLDKSYHGGSSYNDLEEINIKKFRELKLQDIQLDNIKINE